MRRQYVFNRILSNEQKKKEDDILALKIQKAKSSLDLNCPESFNFFKTQFREGIFKNKCIYIFIISVMFYSEEIGTKKSKRDDVPQTGQDP